MWSPPSSPSRPQGFNGFYLQTGGTGGATDATPGASDAVFVFTPSYDETNLALGSTVTVTGAVSEFFGLTEITATSVAAGRVGPAGRHGLVRCLPDHRRGPRGARG